LVAEEGAKVAIEDHLIHKGVLGEGLGDAWICKDIDPALGEALLETG